MSALLFPAPCSDSKCGKHHVNYVDSLFHEGQLYVRLIETVEKTARVESLYFFTEAQSKLAAKLSENLWCSSPYTPPGITRTLKKCHSTGEIYMGVSKARHEIEMLCSPTETHLIALDDTADPLPKIHKIVSDKLAAHPVKGIARSASCKEMSRIELKEEIADNVDS